MSKDDNKNNKNGKNNNLILLKSIMEENGKLIELSENEIELKEKLVNIENKLISIEKIIASINNDKDNNIYNSEAFGILLNSIAITAAVNVIAEYFNIDIDRIDDILE